MSIKTVCTVGMWRRSDPESEEQPVSQSERKESRKKSRNTRLASTLEGDSSTVKHRRPSSNVIDRHRLVSVSEDEDTDCELVETGLRSDASSLHTASQHELVPTTPPMPPTPPVMSAADLRHIIEQGELHIVYGVSYNGYSISSFDLHSPTDAEFDVVLDLISSTQSAAQKRTRNRSFPVTVVYTLTGIQSVEIVRALELRIDVVQRTKVTHAVRIDNKQVSVSKLDANSVVIKLHFDLVYAHFEECIRVAQKLAPADPYSVEFQLGMSINFSGDVVFNSISVEGMKFRVSSGPGALVGYMVERADATNRLLGITDVDEEDNLQRRCLEDLIMTKNWPSVGRDPYVLFLLLVKALMSSELEEVDNIIRRGGEVIPPAITNVAVASSVAKTRDELRAARLISEKEKVVSIYPYLSLAASRAYKAVTTSSRPTQVALGVVEHRLDPRIDRLEEDWRTGEIPILFSKASSRVYDMFDRVMHCEEVMSVTEILKHRAEKDKVNGGAWKQFVGGLFKKMNELHAFDSALAHQLWRSFSIAVLSITCVGMIRRIKSEEKIDTFIASDNEACLNPAGAPVAAAADFEAYMEAMANELDERLDQDGLFSAGSAAAPEDRIGQVTKQLLELAMLRLDMRSQYTENDKSLSSIVRSVSHSPKWIKQSKILIRCYLHMFAAIYRYMRPVHAEAMLCTPFPYINPDGQAERVVCFLHYVDIRALLVEIEFGPCVPRKTFQAAEFRSKFAEALNDAVRLGYFGLDEEEREKLQEYIQAIDSSYSGLHQEQGQYDSHSHVAKFVELLH